MKVMKVIVNIFMVVAAVATLAMLFIVVLDVILRIFFKSPIVGATEITQMLMVCITPAIGGTILENRMTKVDVLVEKFPKGVQVVVDTIMYVITIVLFGLLTWRAFDLGTYQQSIGKAYSMLKIPEYPFLYLLAFAFAVSCVATIVVLVQYLKTSKNKPDEKLTVAEIVMEDAAANIEIAEEETEQ